MQKFPKKKLQLHRETLRNLEQAELQGVAGATHYTTVPTCGNTCLDTCGCPIAV